LRNFEEKKWNVIRKMTLDIFKEQDLQAKKEKEQKDS
jgi:hypothetical protein